MNQVELFEELKKLVGDIAEPAELLDAHNKVIREMREMGEIE